MASEKKHFIILDDKDQVWGLMDAVSTEDAIQLARKIGYEPYYVIEENLATRVWEEEEINRKYFLKEREDDDDELPEWTDFADYTFVNELGEAWYAKIDEDGSVTITGSDVDWEEKTIRDVDNTIRLAEESLAKTNNIFFPYVMHKCEALWLLSVLEVAKTKKTLSP